jgi:hypothetical protein
VQMTQAVEHFFNPSGSAQLAISYNERGVKPVQFHIFTPKYKEIIFTTKMLLDNLMLTFHTKPFLLVYFQAKSSLLTELAN